MKACLLCKKPLSVPPFLALPKMPSCAQNLPDDDTLSSDCGIDLNLCQCPFCGLVQLDCSPVDYYRDVIRAGGGTSTMRDLRKSQYEEFIRLCKLQGKRILEVGCGQGEFLDMWSDFPVQCFGIENNATLVAQAKAKGLRVRQDFADAPGHTIAGGPYDAFTQFNFIEHQPAPNEMIRCIWENLVPGGYGLVTAPSFEYIRNDCVYEIMRDHIAYYTMDTLRLLFVSNGFDIIQSEIVNRDTLSLIVRKRTPPSAATFNNNYGSIRRALNDFVSNQTQNCTKLAIWGASHQGFTSAAFLDHPEKISYIIDSAVFKQGKYAPASHIPIVAPDHFRTEPVQAILILAPGYTEEIAYTIRKDFQHNVKLFAMRSNVIESL